MIEFSGFPKIARLNRDIIITEKIDGTNGAVIIEDRGDYWEVGAQSRNRLLTPEDDNHGFAAWVYDNAHALAEILGPGRHFGEWWGSGINRGYGLKNGQKYFSLFNVKRWDPLYDQEKWPAGLSIVPVLYWGPFSEQKVKARLRALKVYGSSAHYGFMQPEGIVVYHTAANEMFKVTLVNDEKPKGVTV